MFEGLPLGRGGAAVTFMLACSSAWWASRGAGWLRNADLAAGTQSLGSSRSVGAWTRGSVVGQCAARVGLLCSAEGLHGPGFNDCTTWLNGEWTTRVLRCGVVCCGVVWGGESGALLA